MKNCDVFETIRNVEIRKSSAKDNFLKLSNDLVDSNLTKGTYLMKVGLRQVTDEVEIFPNDNKTNILFLKEKVLDSLSLPEGIRLNLKCDGENLILGPLIGVFISHNKIEKLLDGYWDSVYWRFQNWGAEKGGLVYFFDYSGIDWEEKKVDGYYWNDNRDWSKCTYPLPEVIYDRCFGKNSRDVALKLRENIANQNLPIRVFNQVVKITKKETYEHLVKYPRIKNHVPFFSPYSSEKLIQMLHQMDSVYIKPVSLYKGQGVLRVKKKDKKFIIEFPGEESNERKVCQDLPSLLRELDQILLPDHEYVLQESIQLASFLG
ncbi:MAG: YheC/YheD family protein, partial [Desulfitobacterium sp.]|nr:YheC/YheD family protein [Desulfitobacterium sp.]